VNRNDPAASSWARFFRVGLRVEHVVRDEREHQPIAGDSEAAEHPARRYRGGGREERKDVRDEVAPGGT